MNRTMRIPILAFAVQIALTIAPVAARAEVFVDLYAGVAMNNRSDLHLEVEGLGFVFTQDPEDVKLDDSLTFGGRVGYWFGAIPYRGVNVNYGIAVDAFRFRPDIGPQEASGILNIGGVLFLALFDVQPIDITVTGISLDLMVRGQVLPSPEFPRGRLQPYFTVGPAAFIVEAEDSTNFDPTNQSEGDTSVGVKVGAGLAWNILKHVAVFGEYRFMHFSPDFRFTDLGSPVTMEMDVNTHHFVGGIGLRF